MVPAQIKAPRARVTVMICGILLTIFAAVSSSAVLTKNATIDEPLDSISGWVELRRADFRVFLVNPPLWQCWAALGNAFANPTIKYDSPLWNNLTWEPVDEYAWTDRTLYQTPGTNGDAFVNRSRMMMLLLGVGLGVLIAGWSYRLAGPIAAVTATLFFSFDPNFIAHSPLVKSDVALSLVLTGLACLTWSLGHHANVFKTIAIGLLCGAAIGVKFSGVIVGPILITILLIRVISNRPWLVGRKMLVTRTQRLGAMILIGCYSAVVSFIFIWGCYDFRYRPAPLPAVRINLPAIYERTALIETTLETGHHATTDEISRHAPSLPTRLIKFADRYHILPQALLGGILYQRDCTLAWPAFLDGQLYGNGRWYYFPLAMLYKTPIATLTAFAGAGFLFIGTAMNRWRSIAWPISCLVIPFAIFGLVAMRTPLNIGLRSVLPLYPFMFIAVGCTAAWGWARRPRITLLIISLLAIGLMVETLPEWPDYIAFFNVAVGGKIGGLKHLSDSSLDWGQDIKPLAAWQRTHPAEPMFIDYDGSIDPHFYGLKYHPIWLDTNGQPVSDVPLTPGLLAIRATHLQGLYIKPQADRFYRWLRGQQPVAVIGGTIYVFQFQP